MRSIILKAFLLKNKIEGVSMINRCAAIIANTVTTTVATVDATVTTPKQKALFMSNYIYFYGWC